MDLGYYGPFDEITIVMDHHVRSLEVIGALVDW